MSNDPEKLIDAATRDQLADCVRLLALSIVHHRAKSGFVAIEHSMARLRSNHAESATSDMRNPGGKVLEQALALVASPPIRPARQDNLRNTILAEKRRQLRIKVTAPIKVIWSADPVPKMATLENISWGGAGFHVARAMGNTGDRVDIVLPSTRFGSITVEAKIIRTWNLPDAQGAGVAARFSSLSTRDEAELDNILEVLAQSGDVEGHRQSAKLTQRLEIQYDDTGDLLATLGSISAGGLEITVPDPLELGQSFQTVISTLDDRCILKLRARVVHQDAIRLGATSIYNVGLQFGHPSEDLRDRTNELIREITALTPAGNARKANGAI